MLQFLCRFGRMSSIALLISGTLALGSFLLVSSARPASAEQGVVPVAAPAPEDLRTLAALLEKPSIRAWLEAQSAQPSPVPARQPEPASMAQLVGDWLDAVRANLRTLTTGLWELPAQFALMGRTLGVEIQKGGPLAFFGPIAAFAALGFLFQEVFWRLTAGLRRRTISIPLQTVGERLRAIGWRTLYGAGVVAAFAAGSVGAFLLLDWPPLLQQIALTYLLVFLAVRLTLVGGRIVLAPGAERFRVVPMATMTARYWFVWSATLAGAFYFAKGTFRLVPVLGATMTTRTILGIAISAVLLVLALIAVWQRPSRDETRPRARGSDGVSWLVSLWLLCIWMTAWTGSTQPFDIGVVLLLLALASFGLRLAVNHLLRSPDEVYTGATPRPLAITIVHRGLRIIVLVGGSLVIARILNLDVTALAATDSRAMRAARSVIDVVIVALTADFMWQIARAWIDHRIRGIDPGSEVGATSAHEQRLRTLLPVLRTVLLITVIMVGGMMALSTLGVAIGPLIAGAGVVGIAVGFGAQTLVKDIISGMFFLLDDAFRLGEYIESGHIKGTVEAFSLRSVKVRHHRGPLHTVPFGALSTITNYSRDWVIDKMTIGVTYDTNLDQVRRIVKKIGRTLQEDTEFAPQILETLKMQGVEQFGDFAIQIRLKMMTRPGEQFLVRRRAYALMKEAFEREGIQFASPTVTVAGGGGSAAAPVAAAQAALGAAAAAKPAV